MQFTVRFHDHVINSINHIVQSVGPPKVTIEIGCFEGETTFNLTHILKRMNKDYKHYAIDPYAESADLPAEKILEVKERFLNNLKEITDGSIEFLHMPSFDGLIELYKRGVKADLIYVDGDHRAPGVLQDMVLGFELLNIGGVMLCDDAVSWRYKHNITDSPKMAIDNFIQCNWNRLEVFEIPNGYQTAIRRKS